MADCAAWHCPNMLALPAGEEPCPEVEAIDKLAAMAALALTIEDMSDDAAALELGTLLPPAALLEAPFAWLWDELVPGVLERDWLLRELPERLPQRLGLRWARKLEADVKLIVKRFH